MECGCGWRHNLGFSCSVAEAARVEAEHKADQLPKVGGTVRTKNMMFFVEAHHPETGDEIETQFPRWHSLKVLAVDA